ncbi:MAG: ATP-grasp domain-containing protein [Candidatus Omnitrophica bacterium]|nr:ATP-grasp domain-containing protein [Candidatus Omnitrophota bacterium]
MEKNFPSFPTAALSSDQNGLTIMPKQKILVVGTTIDYVEILNSRFQNRLIFLTDEEERGKSENSKENNLQEIVVDLENSDRAQQILFKYLKEQDIKLSGVVCFDCESLALASTIAQQYELPFPTAESIMNCRSKFRSKDLWAKNGVSCPKAKLIKTEEDALEFFKQLKAPAVLKPLSSSGSELVFLCKNEEQCREAYRIMSEKLKNSLNRRMYTSQNMRDEENPRDTVVMEEYIGGDEYSCDFVLENKTVSVIRLTRKYYDERSTFGTMQAYQLPAELPSSISLADLESFLLKAAHSLGLTRSITMVDFKIYNGRIYLIEMTPRPGGDCLPILIEASSGFDIFSAALDFSEGKSVQWPKKTDWNPVVGLHLIATQRGVLKKLDVQSAEHDPRFVRCYRKRFDGESIELPPDDYDSRLLGFVLFKPSSGISISQQCGEILKNITIEVE